MFKLQNIFYLLSCLFPVYLCAQVTNLKFENYDTAEGVSSSTCLEIFQDSDGFLWFGTIDGLNRFNGYNFEVFRPSLKKSNAISNNRVNTITEDAVGRLWIGTANGLNIFDKKTQHFYKVNFTGNKEQHKEIINALFFDKKSQTLFIGSNSGLTSLSIKGSAAQIANHAIITRYTGPATQESNITNIISDGYGTLWMTSDSGYLSSFSIKDKRMSHFEMDRHEKKFLGHLPKQLVLDSKGRLWIGNDLSHIYIFDVAGRKFIERSFANHSIPIFHILKDKKGILWFSTDGHGLYLIKDDLEIIQHILHESDNPLSLPNNQPSKVLEDNTGIFWIGSYNKGVTKLALSKSLFGHYYYRSGRPEGLSTKIAQSVVQDNEGKIWIGTDGGGLNLFNEKNKTFTYFKAGSEGHNALSSDKILNLKVGLGNTLWIGTWDGGLIKFDTKSYTAKSYKNNPDDIYSIGQNTVWCLETDLNGNVWLGTPAAGLNMFDPVTEHFFKYKSDTKDTTTLVNNFVFSVFRDSKNRLFAGTARGLCYTNLGNGLSLAGKTIFHEVKIKNLSENRINFITEDHLHHIWVGTDVGLYKLSPRLSLIKAYSLEDGLPNNLVVGIQEDNSGNIWLTTKSGLSVLNPKTDDIRNFNVHDGLQGFEFQSKSICKTLDGRIIAGGINGFNIFNPADMGVTNFRPKPVINELRLYNKKVNPGDTIGNRVVITKSLMYSSRLELKYDEDYLSLGFVALNYLNPEQVKYAYRLEGLHDNFVELGNDRLVNYSNLSPGNYVFEVLASKDGNWKQAEKASLELTILPPPWKTWWAYLIYTVLLSTIIVFALKYYTKKIREEKEHELDQMKLNFFINVSHEFRTPLTLILNPVDKILSCYNDAEQVKLSALTIQRSSRRLLYLVNQLLDFRKVDLGESTLELQRVNIEKFIRDIFFMFEDLAKAKDLEIIFESALKSRIGMFDPDKLEKMLTNLLSNAIKFTKPGGTIKVSLEEVITSVRPRGVMSIFYHISPSDYLQVSVSDTGVGFKKEHLKDVFKRFFRADATMGGTGIGLNYTKALVELHKGKIDVDSVEGKGTIFTILLPFDLKPEKRAKNGALDMLQYSIDMNPVKSAEYEIAISDENDPSVEGIPELPDSELPVLLIVEDNKELRTHLRNELSNYYKVKEASNGATGLELVNKYYPDIVISDVMMPKMDGFEMCRQIKNKLETSHIPVILLTARSLEEDRIEGYDTGADEYLPKPFNINVLKARIKNLLESKKRSRERFTSIGIGLPVAKNTTSTIDEVFIDKATKIVLDNISNIDFSLEDIIRELDLGRSQFYRKINAITGQNPSNFIRTVKLKKASELLSTKQYSIKEVTHMCGFNSSAYFTKTFKELFGVTPTQFMERKL